jgi:hypothetical protein
MKSRLVVSSAVLAIPALIWLCSQAGHEQAGHLPVSVTRPAQPAVAPVAEAGPAEALKAISDFRAWSGSYLKSPPDQRMAMLETGKAYAREHTREISKMIKTDPQAAISQAVPMVVRQKLPPEIVELLEERPRLRGDYEVYGNVPIPGATATVEPYTRTVTSREGRQWNAYVYGRRQNQRSTMNVSLNGIAVGLDMAVSDSPIRALEVGEVPELAGRESVEVCPVSGTETPVEKTVAGAPPPPVTEETPAFETPEQVIYVCSGGHISQMAEKYMTDEEKAHWAALGADLNAGTGTGPAHGPVGSVPSGWTLGNRTFLYIRAAFPDNPVDPQNEQECYDMLKQTNDFVVLNSYGRCYLTYAVPPLVILPYPLSWYNRYDSDYGGGDFLIQTHARQIARSMGYDYLSYNMDAVRWSGGPGFYGGSASVGGRGMRMKTSSSGTFTHELGHNLGVWHANYWRTSPPSFTGPGSNLEYGNIYDVMGSSGGAGSYTASFKNELSWMPQEQFWNVTSSGLYRIHQTDDGTLDPSLRNALRIRRDVERSYWAEFRQLHTSNTGLMNGLMMTWDQWGLGGIGGSGGSPVNGSNRGAQLLDMTPGSFGQGIFDTRDDSALWLGRTYSDPDFGIYITPVARNMSTTPPSIDVQVQIGDVAGNTAPTLTLSASTTSTSVGNNITLTANATDAEGDPLAYAWVFGDGEYSVNNNAVQTKSWTAAGHYNVLCTASDMKGRRTTSSVLITVGSPSTFTVRGNITNPAGQPLEGVYVANYTPSNNTSHSNSNTFRGTWTDSAGNYVLTGLSAGSYNITPTLYPLSFSPSNHAVTVGPNVVNRNFTTSNLPALTITYPDSTASEAAVPGTAVIRLTRSGSTTSALSVQIYNADSGSARRNTDYTLSPAPSAATSPQGGSGTSQYTIPAGAAFLDITVTPINDAAVEGVEYASLDFVNTSSGYYMGGNPRAVMAITDDESNLPVVQLTAEDDVGNETGPDTLRMKLERSGATTAALTVNLAYSGMATNVTDYTAPASVTIPAGSASTTFTITPVNDILIETTETLVTSLASNAAYLRDGIAQSVTSILNDNDMPVVSVAATTASVSEAGIKGVFTISRTGTPSTSLTVDYAINGRAVMGTDYRRLDGRAVIPAGSSSITVEIVPFDDTLDEGTQNVILQLRTAQNYIIDSTESSATVNITDNDAPQFYVEMNTGFGVEPASGSSNGPIFQIHRPSTGTAVTVNYTISGTATSGVDFTALSGTLNFATSDTSRTIAVSMLADAAFENAETVILTLQPGTGYSFLPGQNISATGYILDGDQDVVDVSVADDTSSLTTHTSETSFSEFLISRRGSTGALSVSYSLSGTAASPADYTAYVNSIAIPLSGTLIIPDGETDIYVMVDPVNDSVPEGVENVTLTVTPVSGSYGTRFASATMLIGDNDSFGGVAVGFNNTAATVSEGVGTYSIPVSITGSPGTPVSVRYRVNGGTAAGNGIDFTLPEGVLTFAVGESTKNIPLAIRQDMLPEPDETLTVQLFNVVGTGLGSSNFVVTISNVSLPEAFSDPASGVSSAAMTFNGRVIPGGLATTYWFEYGGTTAYGQTTPVQNLAAGNAPITVSTLVTGLTLSSYHFRLVAQNSSGISYGIDQFPGIISEPPIIVEPPQDLVVNVGDSASFSVTASGGGLSYQWQKGTTDIPLATASTYTIPVTTLASTGSYRCVVTNTDGTATSSAATLTVVAPPVVTQDPSPQAVNAGQNVAFTVTATGLFLTYQWQKDTVDLLGQTGPTLSLTNVTTLNDGSYRCVVSNSAGSDTSAAATLVVDGPPSIVQPPQGIAVNLGAQATFTVVANGPGLSYQWQKDSGTGMADILNSTSSSHVIAITTADDAVSYRCRVTNTRGSVTSTAAKLIVVTPPVLVAPLAPSSVALNQGKNFSASVQIAGQDQDQGPFLNYQWRRNGQNVPDATEPTLSIVNLTESHNGGYTCRVWNAAGEVISPAVTLTVVTPPVITNEPEDTLVQVNATASVTVSASGPFLTYQWWRNGLPVTGVSGAATDTLSFPSMSLGSQGLYYCKVTNTAGTATSRTVRIGIQGMPIISKAPYPALAEAGSPLKMEVEAEGENLTYKWKLNGKDAGSGSTLDIWPFTTKNAGTYIAEARNDLQTATSLPIEVRAVSDMSPALDHPQLKWCTSGPAHWRPTPAAIAYDKKDALSISSVANGNFSKLSTRLTGPLILKWRQKISTELDGDVLRVQIDGEDVLPVFSGEQDWQEISIPFPAGMHQIDFVYTKNDSLAGGQDRVWLDTFSTAPAFEPAGVAENRIVASGTTVTFNAQHTGHAPTSYQWRKKGKAIKGATGAQFIINGIKTTDAGIYDCVQGSMVNGLLMTRTTPPVVVSVVDATSSRKVIAANTSLTLAVTAVGGDPASSNFTYLWKRTTRTFTNEKLKTFSLTFRDATYSDDYYCTVTNSAGSVDAGRHTIRVFQSGPEITLSGALDPAVLSGSYSFQVPYDQLPARTPTTFVAKSLPKGLVIDNATGLITGIPEESRELPYPVTITASNSIDSDTVETSILIHGLGTKTGIFTGLLPRSPQINQDLGGRIDLVITPNGSFSGTLVLGAAKHSFKARLQTLVSNLTQATASFDVARGKDAAVRVDLTLTESGLMTGTATLGSSVVPINGWKAPWSKTAPAAAYAGTATPAGTYTFALTMPAQPALDDPKSPQGTGYGTFIINRDTGAVSITGRLADNASYTCSGFIGAQGQLLLFSPLYTAPALGSLCGTMTVSAPVGADDNSCTGSVSWARPAMSKERLDPDGFPGPVSLSVDGGRYVAPSGATGLILGLDTSSASQVGLSFLHGGIGNSPPSPDITVTLSAGNKVGYPVAEQNPRKTTLTLTPAKGSFTGSFTLEDNDPLDLRPPPAVRRKISRKVSFQGLLVRGTDGWKGAGYFLLPELPDATGETITKTPVHSGAVRLLPNPPLLP